MGSISAHMGGVRQDKKRVAYLEDKVRQLESNKGGGTSKPCRTCTRGAHESKCQALSMSCFSCNQLGYMKNSKAYKQSKTPVKAPEKHKSDAKASQVAEEVDTDCQF